MPTVEREIPLFDFEPVRTEAERRSETRAMRRKATKRATRHADEVREGWTADARRWVLSFGVFAGHTGAFLIEEARAWAEARGFAPPPDKRAWGGVPTPMVAAGHLEPVGHRKAADGSPKTTWRLTKAGIQAAKTPDEVRA